jgi:hypothetical protein
MMTIRNLERQWNAKRYPKLLAELLEARPEAGFEFEPHASQAARVAALLLIRLEELDQSHVPLADTLLRTLVAMQDADGGWGDPAVTALCLRALFCNHGAGVTIDRGLAYLANLQQPGGIWPAAPFRRMPADPLTSAFILAQLGRQPRFQLAVRLDDADEWFAQHRPSIGAEAVRAWDRARARCAAVAPSGEPAMLS